MPPRSTGITVKELVDAITECCDEGQEERPAFMQKEAKRSYYDSIGQHAVVASDSRSLVETLFYAGLRGWEITSIQAQHCGIAFLATDPYILSALQLSVRHVRSLSFQADLVSNNTFIWDGSKLILPALEYRQEALRRTIADGLLGRFMAIAEHLEELDISLRCHEISSLQVDASDLVNFFGNHCWPQLRRLKLRGVWTSEDQLLDLIGRHTKTLQYLEIADIVLKEGTWWSFFERLKSLVLDSLITAERCQLSGSLGSRMALGEWQHWELDAFVTQNKSLGDFLIEFIFWGGESSLLNFPPFSKAR